MNFLLRAIGIPLMVFCVSVQAHASEMLEADMRCAAPVGSPAGALVTVVNQVRARDTFYQYLRLAKGLPVECRGIVLSDPEKDRGWVAFRWPDDSQFKWEFGPPEFFRATYSRKDGINQELEATAAFRRYAEQRGLKIDWAKSTTETSSSGRIVEYSDEDPGHNSFVRLSYDQAERLIALTLSMSL